MGDQSLIIGGPGLGHRQFRLDPGRPGRFFEALCALHDQRHPQRGDVVGEVLASSSRTRLSHIAAARSAMQPQDESIGRTHLAGDEYTFCLSHRIVQVGDIRLLMDCP
jgi:hypothetical protein